MDEPYGSNQRFKRRRDIDPDTGEIKEWLTEDTDHKRGPKPRARKGFAMIFIRPIFEIPPIPWSAFRLLLVMTEYAQGDTGVIHYDLTVLAKEIDVPRTQMVWKLVQQLIDAGLLLRVRRSTVMLNPDYLWVGDALSQSKARDVAAVLMRGENINA